MPKGERHAPFAPGDETTQEYARMGGKAAAVANKQRKRLSQIADDLLSKPCQGKDVLDALEAAGFATHRGKTSRHISNAVALTANIIRIGQGMDANAAVRAYQALAEMERIQAERDAATAKSQSGGVVILPPVDDEDPADDGGGDG